MLQLNYHTDAGHGWLEVDKKSLTALKIGGKITKYSYQKGTKAFLEEDCDMGTYLKALDENGIPYNLIHLPQEDWSKIRNYSQYKK